MRVLLFLLPLFVLLTGGLALRHHGFQEPGGRAPPPHVAVQNQILALKEAVTHGDSKSFMQLFDYSDADVGLTLKTMELTKRVKININSAHYLAYNKIETDLVFFPMKFQTGAHGKWLLVKNPQSPTGWKIDGIQQEKSPRGNWVWCYVGMFQCFNEFISRISSGDF